jgi:hypothetical protein
VPISERKSIYALDFTSWLLAQGLAIIVSPDGVPSPNSNAKFGNCTNCFFDCWYDGGAQTFKSCAFTHDPT